MRRRRRRSSGSGSSRGRGHATRRPLNFRAQHRREAARRADVALVAVVGDDRCDRARRCAARCRDEEQQLDKVLVDGLRCRLDDIDVLAPDALEDLYARLSVREAVELNLRERHAQLVADLVSEGAIGGSTKEGLRNAGVGFARAKGSLGRLPIPHAPCLRGGCVLARHRHRSPLRTGPRLP